MRAPAAIRIFLAAALALLPSFAFASADSVIAAHPLTVVGVSPAETEEFTALYATELARLDVSLADSVLVRSFLEGQGGSCQGKEACLAALAKASKASSALWVTLAPFTPKIVVSAKVVRADGSVARSVAGLEFEKAARNPTHDDVRNAFRKLFETLRLTSPEIASLVEEPQTHPNTNTNSNNTQTQTTNPPTEVKTPVERTTRSTIGMITGGIGIVGVGVGTVFLLQSKNNWSKFEDLYRGGTFAASDRAELIRIKDQAQSQETVAMIGFIGGAALVGVGTYLYLSDAPTPSSAHVMIGPGSIGVAGSF